jgi:hypothetical protein
MVRSRPSAEGMIAQPRGCEVSGRALEEVVDALGHVVMMVPTIFIPLPLPLPGLCVLFCPAVGSCREMGAIPAASDQYRLRGRAHPLSATIKTTSYGVVRLPEAVVT